MSKNRLSLGGSDATMSRLQPYSFSAASRHFLGPLLRAPSPAFGDGRRTALGRSLCNAPSDVDMPAAAPIILRCTAQWHQLSETTRMSDLKPKRGSREDSAAAKPPVMQPPPTEIAPITVTAVGESPESVTVSPTAKKPDAPPPQTAADQAWAGLTEAQAALARGFEQVAVEMTGVTRKGIMAATDAALALLGARTLAEVIEINAGLARRGIDTAFEGSAKLSEIGVKIFADASRPLLNSIGRA